MRAFISVRVYASVRVRVVETVLGPAGARNTNKFEGILLHLRDSAFAVVVPNSAQD